MKPTLIFISICCLPLLNFYNHAPPETPGKAIAKVVKYENHDQDIERLVNRFYNTAKTEQQKYGIPVSIKLGQAILESGKGKSKLVRTHNNWFAMKAFKKGVLPKNIKLLPKGKSERIHDDHKDDRFWSFHSAWDSWRYHSELITTGAYEVCVRYNNKDYEGWAYCLKKVGYATDKNYTNKLVAVIENNELQNLD